MAPNAFHPLTMDSGSGNTSAAGPTCATARVDTAEFSSPDRSLKKVASDAILARCLIRSTRAVRIGLLPRSNPRRAVVATASRADPHHVLGTDLKISAFEIALTRSDGTPGSIGAIPR